MIHVRPRTGIVSAKKEAMMPIDPRLRHTHVSSLPLNTPIIHSTRPFSAETRKSSASSLTFHTNRYNRKPSTRQTLKVSAPMASTKPDLPYFIDPCIEQYMNLDLVELSSPRPPRTPSASEDAAINIRCITHPRFRAASKLSRGTNESYGPTAGESALINEINMERAKINPIVITGTFPFNEDLAVSQSLPTRVLSAPLAAAPTPYKNVATARSIPIVTFPKEENTASRLHNVLDIDIPPLLTVERSNSKTPKRKVHLDWEKVNLKVSYTPDILHKEPANEVIQRRHTQLKKVVVGAINDISIHNAEPFHTDQMASNGTNSLQEQSLIREQRGRIPSRATNDREKYKSRQGGQLSHRSFTTATDIYSSESLASLETSVGSPTAKSRIDIEDDIKIFTNRASPFNAELSGRALGPGHISISCEPSSDTRPAVSINTRYLSVTSLSQINDNDKLQRERRSTLELLDDRMYPQKTQ